LVGRRVQRHQLVERAGGETVGGDRLVDGGDDARGGGLVGVAEVIAAPAQLLDQARGERDVDRFGVLGASPAEGVEDDEGVAVDDRERVLGFGAELEEVLEVVVVGLQDPKGLKA
jgi:hypothetical protein